MVFCHGVYPGSIPAPGIGFFSSNTSIHKTEQTAHCMDLLIASTVISDQTGNGNFSSFLWGFLCMFFVCLFVVVVFFVVVVVVVFCSKQGSVFKIEYEMSRIVRKPDFCLGENKGADQLRGNREADQRICFRYTDSTISLLLKSEISSF